MNLFNQIKFCVTRTTNTISLAGIAQSVQRQALDCEVVGSNLPVAQVVASPFQGVKLGPGPGMEIQS